MEENLKTLEFGVNFLMGIDAKELESVEVETTKYDDGSRMVSVSVRYPVPEEVNEVTYYGQGKDAVDMDLGNKTVNNERKI